MSSINALLILSLFDSSMSFFLCVCVKKSRSSKMIIVFVCPMFFSPYILFVLNEGFFFLSADIKMRNIENIFSAVKKICTVGFYNTRYSALYKLFQK